MNWLRDYVYVPLGGKNDSEFKQHLNSMIVFLLSGLWHGASWTFVLWGFFWGIVNSIYRVLRKVTAPKDGSKRPPTNKYLVPINVIFTFVLVVFSCFFYDFHMECKVASEQYIIIVGRMFPGS